jgi:DNA adenine methylase
VKIAALAPWYGSKRTLAPRIVEALGPHQSYWEPFCGSMAVLLAKPVARSETVNDLHGDLINLARVLQDDREGPRLYRRLRRVLASAAELEDARCRLNGADLGETGPARAYAYFINSWLSMNGIAGTPSGEDGRRGICRRFTSNGGDPATRFVSAVASIPAFRRRLRGVTVMRDCGIELCEKIEDKRGTVIYADPPYFCKTTPYVHDLTDEQHNRLARALGRFRHTRVVVSYYDDPRLRELYAGWQHLDCTMTKSLVNPTSQGEKTSAPEVLLLNRPQTASLF